MASIADAQAAFAAYHDAVSAKLQELAVAAADADAQPLVDAISAAQGELAPPVQADPAA